MISIWVVFSIIYGLGVLLSCLTLVIVDWRVHFIMRKGGMITLILLSSLWFVSLPLLLLVYLYLVFVISDGTMAQLQKRFPYHDESL